MKPASHIRILQRPVGDKFKAQIATLDQLQGYIADQNCMVWVDLLDPESNPHVPHAAEPDIEKLLHEVFEFHPLALDDALIETHSPKLDDWGDHLYVVLHDVDFDNVHEIVDTHEIDIFIGKNYLVTYHNEASKAIDRVWTLIERDDRHLRRGVDRVLYALADSVASDYMPCVEALEAALDDLQDSIFKGDMKFSPTERIFGLKRSVLNIRRILTPQREVMNRLARDEHSVISNRERVYFRDVYDHFVRMVDLTESLRDITTGALDTYLSITANRTNEVMKTLTMVTVLFMPLAFLTGFFGMNFFGATYEIPAPVSPIFIFIINLIVMITVPLAMMIYIRKRGWF